MILDIFLIYLAGVLLAILLLKINSRKDLTSEWGLAETILFSLGSWVSVLPLLTTLVYYIIKLPKIFLKDS